MDVGALCLPGLAEKIHGLVEDARSKGAKVLAGGYLPVGPGQYYPPTVIAGVDRSMKIFYEEVFGPVMSVVSHDVGFGPVMSVVTAPCVYSP